MSHFEYHQSSMTCLIRFVLKAGVLWLASSFCLYELLTCLFAMELNLRNILASFQTNTSPKHRIKRFTQQQRTLKNCYVIQVFQNHNWNSFKSFSSLSIRVFVCVYVLGGYFHTLFGGSFHCLNFGKFYDTAPLA